MGHKISVDAQRSDMQLEAANTSCRRAVLGFIAARLAHAQGVGDSPDPIPVTVYSRNDELCEGWYLVWVGLTGAETVCVLAQDLDTETEDIRAISVTVDLSVDDYATTDRFEVVTTGMREGDDTPTFWAFVQSTIALQWNEGIYFAH